MRLDILYQASFIFKKFISNRLIATSIDYWLSNNKKCIYTYIKLEFTTILNRAIKYFLNLEFKLKTRRNDVEEVD